MAKPKNALEREPLFMKWWIGYSQHVYVSAPPRHGWMVDVARAAFAAGVEASE